LFETNFINGTGEERLYSTSGDFGNKDVIFLSVNYKNGIQDGETKIYNRSGIIYNIINYRNGLLEGNNSYHYENGNLKEKRFYGKYGLNYTIFYDEIGNVMEIVSGNMKQIFNNGKLNEIQFLVENINENENLINFKSKRIELKDFKYNNRTLIENLKPNKRIKYWEFNIFSHNRDYTNEVRLTEEIQSEDIVLSKTKKGFGSFCPPSNCSWYLSMRDKNNKITTIDDTKNLKKFIGRIDNEYEAWLIVSPLIKSNPVYLNGKFAKVKEGFLIQVKKEEIYLVTQKGEILKI
jgi:hypothetical protein